jgi:hypothetical protein
MHRWATQLMSWCWRAVRAPSWRCPVVRCCYTIKASRTRQLPCAALPLRASRGQAAVVGMVAEGGATAVAEAQAVASASSCPCDEAIECTCAALIVRLGRQWVDIGGVHVTV